MAFVNVYRAPKCVAIDRLSEDEEMEVSILNIARDRSNHATSSLDDSSTTPEKSLGFRPAHHYLQRCYSNDDEDDSLQSMPAVPPKDSFSRRSSLRIAVRGRRPAAAAKRGGDAAAVRRQSLTAAAAGQDEDSLGGTRRCQQRPPSPTSSVSSVSVMSATAGVNHPRAVEALPPHLRPEDLRINLNSLDSLSEVSDFKSMEVADGPESTYL